MIYSDWHIHSEHSYDSKLAVDTIISEATRLGLRRFGITDHVNYNEPTYLEAVRNCAAHVNELRRSHPEMILGVELTPIPKPEYEYLKKHGSRDGYIPPACYPLEIEVAMTKEELVSLGVRYAISATHWRVDVSDRGAPGDMDTIIKEWYRQQMWIATDERTTVLGHPWYHGRGLWYEDFSVIPHSMHRDIGAALLENGKYIECNSDVLCAHGASDRFHRQYAEFLREMFEMGVPVTYGSDCHNRYLDKRDMVGELLAYAGFVDGDISEISENKLW